MKTKHNAESSRCIQNSRQTTGDAHCSLQPFAGIIAERIENIQIDELNYYFSERHYKSLKMSQQQIK